MAVFKHQNLKFNYSHSATNGDASKYTGEPDATLLNRDESYEVLYFIQRFMVIKGLKNVSSGEKIERMIHACPGNLRSRSKISDWIVKNWKK